jgi:hypothetical protein
MSTTPTNLDTLSLVELKKIAQVRRIKQYYIKKREELIALLKMEELPFQFTLEKMTIAELREQAKEKGLRGFWSLHRDDLIKVLYPNQTLYQTASHQQQENHCHA